MAARKKARKPDEALKLNREAFCRYYAQDRDLFGNATHAYAAAFGYELDKLSTHTERDEEGNVIEDSEYDKACHVCAVEASKLLRNPEIDARIVVLLNELLKDEIVDSELAKIIRQDRDTTNKVAAIREFNKLRGRIIDKTQNLSRLPFGETDLSTVIATLSPERQDHYYGIITDLIREAELLRSAGAAQGSGTGNA